MKRSQFCDDDPVTAISFLRYNSDNKVQINLQMLFALDQKESIASFSRSGFMK